MAAARESCVSRHAALSRAHYAERRFAFSAMSNLPAQLRARGSRLKHGLGFRKLCGRYVSVDGSVRSSLFSRRRHPGRSRFHALEGAPERVDRSGEVRVNSALRPRGRAIGAANDLHFDCKAGCAVDSRHFCLTAQLGLIPEFDGGAKS